MCFTKNWWRKQRKWNMTLSITINKNIEACKHHADYVNDCLVYAYIQWQQKVCEISCTCVCCVLLLMCVLSSCTYAYCVLVLVRIVFWCLCVFCSCACACSIVISCNYACCVKKIRKCFPQTVEACMATRIVGRPKRLRAYRGRSSASELGCEMALELFSGEKSEKCFPQTVGACISTRIIGRPRLLRAYCGRSSGSKVSVHLSGNLRDFEDWFASWLRWAAWGYQPKVRRRKIPQLTALTVRCLQAKSSSPLKICLPRWTS